MLRLMKIGAEGEGPCTDIMEIRRPDDLVDIANVGLTLAEAKLLLAGVQREIVAAQATSHAVRRPECPRCDGVCRVKDYRDHAVSTLFGQVTLRLPRFRCAACGGIEAGVGWPSHCRSTPELDRLRAHLSALMTYRTAADVLGQMFPVDAGTHHETLRRHTLKTAFTDGCPRLRRSLANAGVTTVPMLDWFHVAMRLQHLKQIAVTLPTDDPVRGAAKAVIVEEVERLHWRIWNGKAKDAQISIDRIRAVMHHFQGEPDRRRSTAPSRKLWTALRALDDYLTSQSAWLVNYAERHRAGLRVGTAVTEGAANFLVNRRMNKSQQMRWSRRGADLLLQVRCAVYNGTLGSGFGQKFQPANDPCSPMAIAA